LPYPSCHLYLPYLLHLPFQEIEIIECIITCPDVKIKNKVGEENVAAEADMVVVAAEEAVGVTDEDERSPLERQQKSLPIP
jgi:hypothetical protein